MSDCEQTELKAGHAPAMKVGGMRVPIPKHHEEKVEAPKEEEADADQASAGTKNVVISGAVVKEKDVFSAQAAKAIHEKPMPTHSPIDRAINHNPGMTHIQQPRKN